MPKYLPKRYDQILGDMLAHAIAQAELTDVSDTSVFKHILAAAARADAEIYYQLELLQLSRNANVATGDDLDARAKDIVPGTLTRRAAQKATVNLVFSRNGTTGTVTIPAGTRVKTASGVVFTTTSAGTIGPGNGALVGGHATGQDSALVPAIAVVAGAAGNVTAGTLVSFVNKPVGVDSVTNLAAAVFGNDLESDDSFRNRIKTYVASLVRCTPTAVETVVLGAQDSTTGATILFSNLYEDPLTPGTAILYIDDGTGHAETYTAVVGENLCAGLSGPPADAAVGGETTLYLDHWPVRESSTFALVSSTRGTLTQNTHYFVNPATGQVDFSPALSAAEVVTGSYTYYTGLVALAQKIMDGDPDDRTNYPGARAAGILLKVRTPQVLVQNVTMSVVVTQGSDPVATRTAVQTAIVNYINNLPISGDVLVANLYRLAMEVAGVTNCTVTAPLADVILLDHQLARTTTANVSVV